MFGDSFCKSKRRLRRSTRFCLSIPMFGDSFCKNLLQTSSSTFAQTFNPHVWGLFLQAHRGRQPRRMEDTFQSPCLGTLFASSRSANFLNLLKSLSIPMFGDSFCKTVAFTFKLKADGTFNPHVWGLFLQVVISQRPQVRFNVLSIPMFGDSFCKLLGDRECFAVQLSLSIPMFGDSFCKREEHHPEGVRHVLLSIPMFGDSFCKVEEVGDYQFYKNTFNPHVWGLFLQVKKRKEGKKK